MQQPKKYKFNSFDLTSGRVIAKKYEILSKLGSDWEGEVYKIVETGTGIDRAAKCFTPIVTRMIKQQKFTQKNYTNYDIVQY